MAINNNKMFYKYQIYYKDWVEKYSTHSKRLFFKKLRTIKWSKTMSSVLLKISYGRGYFNEGIYLNKKDLWIAFNAFIEDV